MLAPSSPEPATGFSPQEFRQALGSFATGVTIVTAATPAGEPVGLTVNSFNSVSMEPPLVLWSLSRRGASVPVFMTSEHFAVNVLAAEQRTLAERFATRGADRWAELCWRAGRGGAPILAGVAASFECRVKSRHDEGDHIVFIGEVLHCAHRVGAVPLLFIGGRFHAL